MRYLYNLLTYILLIPYAAFWLVRGIGNRMYFDRVGQRLGFGFPVSEGCIWIHAVSVGEVQAAAFDPLDEFRPGAVVTLARQSLRRGRSCIARECGKFARNAGTASCRRRKHEHYKRNHAENHDKD